MSAAGRAPRLVEALDAGRAEGWHLGAVAWVDLGRRGGAVGVAVGDARPGEPLTPGHAMLWMSMSKPITAMAIAMLVERGLVELDAPVARYIPEFAQRDKGEITLRQLLTHTAGLRGSPFRYPDDDWDTIIGKVCSMRIEPGWIVGEDAGYHVHSGWFILGEVVQRVTDERLPEFLRREVFEPLGMMQSWVGMSEAAFARDGVSVSPMYDTSGDVPIEQPFTQRAWLTGCRPGGNGVGPLSDLVAFYRALLETLAGRRTAPWSRATVIEFVTRHRRDTFDRTFKHTLDWGLGFMLNSARHGVDTAPYGFGPVASGASFGHGGYQSSIVFADPERDVAVAVACNGFPGEVAHHERMRRVLRAVEDDLPNVGDGSPDAAEAAC